MIDIITGFPFNSFQLIFYNNQYIIAFSILKVFRVIKYFSLDSIIVEKIIKDFSISTRIERILIFFVNFILLSHCFSCFWIFLASLDENYNWIIYMNRFQSDLSIYVSSLYFIWTTVFTIGYGDILSQNIYERIFR